jgi:4-diphosphocytidyl-2-C-methyl-D-erythritol kinase
VSSRPEAQEAPAKLNLYLHVVGKRPDGYHLLDSLVVFVDLHDSVSAAPADDLSLTVDGPFAPGLETGESNLVLRAARALAAAHGRAPRAALTLTKRIPVAAGLGGGSADAAATLRALSDLWGVAIPPGLALALGADVPACLNGRPVFLSGIGEILRPAPVPPPFGLLLVNPRVALPTAEVFRRRAGRFSDPAPQDEAPGDAAALLHFLRLRRNDLTEAAMQLQPPVRDAIAQVAASGALLTRMSGSGGTVFGLFANEAASGIAARAVLAERPDWFVWSGGFRS